MSDAYDIVSSHHAALATLTEARLAVDRATSRAEARAAEAAVAAAEGVAAGARAAVVAALREGRIASAAHILDLPNDCIDCIVAYLSPEDAALASQACRALRDAVVRAGTPPLIGSVGEENRFNYSSDLPSDWAQDLAERVRGSSPALGARRITFCGCSFEGAGHAALLETVLEAASRATRVDVNVGLGERAQVEAVAGVLLPRAGRGFDLGLKGVCFDQGAGPPFRRIAESGIPVVSLAVEFDDDQDASPLEATSRTLTSLTFHPIQGVMPRLPRLPRLRRLKLISDDASQLSTGQALTSVAPRLNEVVIVGTGSFGGYPPLDYLDDQTFWSSLSNSLTRLVLKPLCIAAYMDWSGLACLRVLRELSIYACHVAVPGAGLRNDLPVAAEIAVDLPQLAPSVTRLTATRALRFRGQTASVLAGLRVLDLRQAEPQVACIVVEDEDAAIDQSPEHQVDAPLVLPPAAATPRLTALLLGYDYPYGDAIFVDFASLLAAPRPTLTTVVVEFATLTCSAARRGLETRVRTALPALRCVHLHSCTVDENAAAATEAFIGALGRLARVCRTLDEECVFCRLFDGEENDDDDWFED